MASGRIQAEVHQLYESGFYRILDFRCRCTDCERSKPEYGESFTVSFVRSGNFYYDIFRNSLDAHTGRIIISKPYHERTVQHTDAPPDQCTIFEFKNSFYEQLKINYQKSHSWFFDNTDLHAVLIKTSPEAEYIHAVFAESLLGKRLTHLLADEMVIELVDTVMQLLHPAEPAKFSARLKKNHLTTIESAKRFLHEHFDADVSLSELADHCFVSLFHFSRIFKEMAGCSPHQYLTGLRLKHAEILIRNTSLPVTDVCFQSGFNSMEHFSYAFRQRYHESPSAFRKSGKVTLSSS